MDECNICRCEFDLDAEGGVEGYLGMIFFQLCPACNAGLSEMYDDE
jgi:hypothetical protein